MKAVAEGRTDSKIGSDGGGQEILITAFDRSKREQIHSLDFSPRLPDFKPDFFKKTDISCSLQGVNPRGTRKIVFGMSWYKQLN